MQYRQHPHQHEAYDVSVLSIWQTLPALNLRPNLVLRKANQALPFPCLFFLHDLHNLLEDEPYLLGISCYIKMTPQLSGLNNKHLLFQLL